MSLLNVTASKTPLWSTHLRERLRLDLRQVELPVTGTAFERLSLVRRVGAEEEVEALDRLEKKKRMANGAAVKLTLDKCKV